MPTALTRRGDFSDFRDTSGNLIPIYDPLTTRLNPAFNSSLPVSASNPQFLRDQFPGNSSRRTGSNAVGRNVASIYPLPNGSGNFDNYTSTVNRDVTDNVFSGRIDHRLSDKDSFFVRFNWGKFKLDAPQGQAACCLPTPAEAAGALRSRPLRRRHPEHAPDDAWRRPSTTRGSCRRRSSTSSATGYAKTMPLTFQSDYGIRAADSLGIRGINVTDFTTGPAEHQHPGPHRDLRRSGVPAGESEAVPLAGRGRAGLDARDSIS